MSQQRRGRIDALADRAAGSSPVSPTSKAAPFAGSSQDQANERAQREGDLRETVPCRTCGAPISQSECPANEIVRYELDQAASMATHPDGEAYLGLPGGGAFDAAVRRKREERDFCDGACVGCTTYNCDDFGEAPA